MEDLCPSDILLLISNHLDSTSKKQLCLVSQYFHSIFAPIVLKNIRVLFCQENGLTSESIDERLQTCQSDLSNLYKYARSLRIHTKGYHVSRHVTPCFLPALWETIGRMSSLKSLELEWSRSRSDEEMQTIMEYQENVVTSVLKATGDRLDCLILKPDFGSPSLPASLERIRGLKSLLIVHDERGSCCSSRYILVDSDEEDQSQPCYCYRRPWMKDVIKPLIALNPELETLEIKQGCKNAGPDPHDILPVSLTNLTSLTISGLKMALIQDDGTPLIHLSPLKNLRHLIVRVSSEEINMDAFWDALKVAKPPLENIVSFQVSTSMINYLASFSGLRSLSVEGIREIQGDNTSEMASTFLKSALPRHAESIERLVINYDSNLYSIPGWDFDPNTWSPALSQLSRLRHLTLFPHLPADGPRSSRTTAPQLIKAYQTILDGIVDIPNLHSLKIEFPQPRFGYETDRREWNMSVCMTLGKVLPELRLVGRKPEVLELYSGTYHCIRLGGASEDGEVWGYDAMDEQQQQLNAMMKYLYDVLMQK